MGTVQSTTTSSTNNNRNSGSDDNDNNVVTIMIQVPVEESLLFGQQQNLYSIRNLLLENMNHENHINTNNNNTMMNILKARYGYTIDTTTGNSSTISSNSNVSHDIDLTTTPSSLTTTTTSSSISNTIPTVGTTSSSVGTGTNNSTSIPSIQQQQQFYYHSTSGRMMKTFPLRCRRNKNNMNINTTSTGNTGAGGFISSHYQFIESTAVIKVTWILEQQIDSMSGYFPKHQQQQQSFRTLTWLEEQVLELQRIRKAVRNMTNVAPYMSWGYLNETNTNNNNNNINKALIASKQIVQNVMMIPQNQKYYLPTSNISSSSSNTSTNTSTGTTNTTTSSNTNTTTIGFIQPGPSILMRPIYLLRTCVYTTLADRLSCRPFLTNIEKLFITFQLIQCIQQLHTVNVIHGFLTTENIGLTSTGYVILLDISSYKARTMLPDDDPSEYVYYFQPQQSSGNNNNNNKHHNNNNYEKRCYLAPERFYTPTTTSSSSSTSTTTKSFDQTTTSTSSIHKSEPPLTKEMDIFSLGCVLTELFLNGERCFDLGDLMEYRRMNQNINNNNNNNNSTNTTCQLPNSIQQKLNKIDSSTIRAACKHMINIDPNQRLSAQEYYDRLMNDSKFPIPFQKLYTILQQMMTGTAHIPTTTTTTMNDTNANSNNVSDTTNPPIHSNTNAMCTLAPDARLVLLVMEYSNILWETMGIRDPISDEYFRTVIGSSIQQLSSSTSKEDDEEEKKDDVIGSIAYTQKLFASVEALLSELDSSITDVPTGINTVSLTPDSTATSSNLLHETPTNATNIHENIIQGEERSELCKDSLLIYVQIILATIRHVQRPSTKLIALQLLLRLAYYVTDEVRIQRIVPVTISLLQDTDPLVRATTIQVITTTVSMITTFPPSDSKIFPQYILKRVAHMISDPTIIVRVTFARCIGILAETAQRFLDVSHTVRLYEVVGTGITNTSGVTSRDEMIRPSDLDVGNDATISTNTVFGDEVTKLLDAESNVSLGQRFDEETTHRTTKVYGDTSSAADKIIINNTYSSELVSLQETFSRWVVHIAIDQSEHCSLPKRAILSDLGRLCTFFGLDGVMSFILPQILAFLNERKDWQLRASLFEALPSVCQCIGQAATEEFVLPCIEIGLVDSEEKVICNALLCLSRIASIGLLSRFAVLGHAINQGSLDNPSLLEKYGPLLLFPSEDVRHHAILAVMSICSMIGPPDCDVYVFPILNRFFTTQIAPQNLKIEDEFKGLLKPAWNRERVQKLLEEIMATDKKGVWTPGAWTSIGVTSCDGTKANRSTEAELPYNGPASDPEETSMRKYLKMLSRHTTQSSVQDRSLSDKTSNGLAHGIEGSGKLAQSVMFPKQNGPVVKDSVPDWYYSLREAVNSSNLSVSEAVSIRSVATLGQIYGLSIMGIEGVTMNDYGHPHDVENSETMTTSDLHSSESLNVEGAINGEWGSESILDPEIADTTLLVTKLKALNVPPLPVKLGHSHYHQSNIGSSTKDVSITVEWKPRPKSLLATSSIVNGHTAPVSRLAVSMDQTFFSSASYDGTCRVWDSRQLDDSGGLLESSIVYPGHSKSGPVRINDIAMVEGTYSLVSGGSDGTVHVWRVDMLKAPVNPLQSNDPMKFVRSRAVGSTTVRSVDTQEGEILSVSHFNSLAASVITFGTQFGVIHSWDLRCAHEPFKLQCSPELGYLTSMALGSDRNWIVSGTSKGYVALWDVRFQQCVKLLRHSRAAPISRLATSTIPLPEHWGTTASSNNVRPFIFVAAGTNECSMFDVFSSSCTECFRVVSGDSDTLNVQVDDPPELMEISFDTSRRAGVVKSRLNPVDSGCVIPKSSINCMVGSIGTSSNSYLITGGDDGNIRFWDFMTPSKCFIINGSTNHMHPRPTFERIDFNRQCRLMLCRQAQPIGQRDPNIKSKKMYHGLKTPEQEHKDSILDVKMLDNNGIISCSRDCTIKVWK